jgi:hypothetical protein
MRNRFLLIPLVALACALPLTAAHGAGSFKAKLNAPNHHPLANKLWPISFSATTNSGKPLHAVAWYEFYFSGQRVGLAHPTPRTPCDAIQDKRPHPVPFTGTLRDRLLWPPRSVGIPLTLKVAIKVKGMGTKRLSWKVVVRKSRYKHCTR